MQVENRKIIFLLGGEDLEMLTIKQLLLKEGFEEGKNLFDEKLNWGAKLSAYAAELKEHKEKTIYGV